MPQLSQVLAQVQSLKLTQHCQLVANLMSQMLIAKQSLRLSLMLRALMAHSALTLMVLGHTLPRVLIMNWPKTKSLVSHLLWPQQMAQKSLLMFRSKEPMMLQY